MDYKTPLAALDNAKKYWKKFLLIFDRDKFKAVLYPDRDWEHLLVLFSAIVAFFAVASMYLYFGVNSAGLASKQPPASPQVTAREKIQSAVTAITKAENNFNDIASKKPKLADPSK